MVQKYEDLFQAYRSSERKQIRDKIIDIKMVLIHKHTKVHAAEIFEVNELTIYTWINKYDKYGIMGLKDQPRSERPPKVSDEILEKLMDEQKPIFPLEMKNIVKKKKRQGRLSWRWFTIQDEKS